MVLSHVFLGFNACCCCRSESNVDTCEEAVRERLSISPRNATAATAEVDAANRGE